MKKNNPVCYIVAGPNGAGKTTYALRYLPQIASCRNFINADEIAKGLSPLDFPAGLMQASRIFLEQINEKIRLKKTFAFETTLSGRTYLPRIRDWRADGWRVILIYLYIPTPEFSAFRVEQRVEQGGHDIPRADIIRRYPRTVRNLFDYMDECDTTLCLDNSGSTIQPIFFKSLGKTIQIKDSLKFARLREYCDYD